MWPCNKRTHIKLDGTISTIKRLGQKLQIYMVVYLCYNLGTQFNTVKGTVNGNPFTLQLPLQITFTTNKMNFNQSINQDLQSTNPSVVSKWAVLRGNGTASCSVTRGPRTLKYQGNPQIVDGRQMGRVRTLWGAPVDVECHRYP